MNEDQEAERRHLIATLREMTKGPNPYSTWIQRRVDVSDLEEEIQSFAGHRAKELVHEYRPPERGGGRGRIVIDCPYVSPVAREHLASLLGEYLHEAAKKLLARCKMKERSALLATRQSDQALQRIREAILALEASEDAEDPLPENE